MSYLPELGGRSSGKGVRQSRAGDENRTDRRECSTERPEYRTDRQEYSTERLEYRADCREAQWSIQSKALQMKQLQEETDMVAQELQSLEERYREEVPRRSHPEPRIPTTSGYVSGLEKEEDERDVMYSGGTELATSYPSVGGTGPSMGDTSCPGILDAMTEKVQSQRGLQPDCREFNGRDGGEDRAATVLRDRPVRESWVDSPEIPEYRRGDTDEVVEMALAREQRAAKREAEAAELIERLVSASPREPNGMRGWLRGRLFESTPVVGETTGKAPSKRESPVTNRESHPWMSDLTGPELVHQFEGVKQVPRDEARGACRPEASTEGFQVKESGGKGGPMDRAKREQSPWPNQTGLAEGEPTGSMNSTETVEPRDAVQRQCEVTRADIQKDRPRVQSGKTVKPQSYDGCTSLVDYKAHFAIMTRLNGWTKEEKGLQLAGALKGQALMVLGSLSTERQGDFSALMRALENRFQPPNQVQLYRAQLKSRKRRDDEGIMELGEDVRRLTMLAYPEAAPSLQDQLCRDALMEALREDGEMVWQLQTQRVTTVDMALQLAVEFEAFRGDQGPPRPKYKLHRGVEESTERKEFREIQRQLQEALAEMKKMSEQIPKIRAPEPRSSRPVQRSGETRATVGMKSWSSGGRGLPRGHPVECWNCHRRGHLQSQCRNKSARMVTSAEGRRALKRRRMVETMEERPSETGLHLVVSIMKTRVHCLIDTGASVSIISTAIYEELNTREKGLPYSENQSGLRLADGTALKTVGSTRVEMEVEGLKLQQNLLICDVGSQVVLGMDFLRSHVEALSVKDETLTVKNKVLKLMMEETGLICRVTAHRKVTIPPRRESVILAKLGSGVRDVERKSGIVEPLKSLAESLQLCGARTFVTPRKGLVPVRIFNPQNRPTTIEPQTLLATFQIAEIAPEPQKPVRAGSRFRVEPTETMYGRAVFTKPESPFGEMVERATEHLSEDDANTVTEALRGNKDVFSTTDKDLGRTDLVQHSINTGGAPPIKQPLRRLPLHQKKVVSDLVDDMLDKGIIEPSTSPWSSPVVLVRKKQGDFRFCVDYRRINEQVVKDAYPLPRIDETLDHLGGAVWFSTMDLSSGYWQVGMRPEDKEKTAFSTSQGLFQFTVMPFGLCNAPATFERLMEAILQGLQWEACLVYLDDIIVFGNTVEEHLERLKQVWARLRTAGLKLKPKKCHLFQRSVQYLGHIVSAQGVAVDPAKVESVKNCPEPKTVRQVRSFLGLASYYRRFIPGFAKIAVPLHELTKKGQEFVWRKEQRSAFGELKERLISAPVLAFPDPGLPFILDTDASGYGIGGVLSQIQEGQERVVAYGSRTLSRAERRYNVTRRELLAMVHHVKLFRPYLYGRPFLIRTDHGALKWLTRFRNPEGQLARWLETLGEYDFTLEHRPGRVHNNADALSREPCVEDLHPEWEEDPELLAWSKKILASLPAREEEIAVPPSGKDDPADPELRRSTRGGHVTLEEAEPTIMRRVVKGPRARRRQEPLEPEQDRARWEPIRKFRVSSRTPKLLVQEAPAEQRTENRASSTENRARVVQLGDQSRQELREAQERDPTIKQVKAWRSRPAKPIFHDVSGCGAAEKTLWLQYDQLEEVDGILHRHATKKGAPDRLQAIVPKELKRSLMHWAHDVPTAGHLGARKTLERLRTNYYWPNMKRDVGLYVGSCAICAKTKSKKGKAQMVSQTTGVVMERVAVDIMGPIAPATDRYNQYILVISDYFTKYVEAYPMQDQEADTIAQLFVEEFCLRYGMPELLHSDQGRQFESRLMQDVCHLLGVKKTRTTPYRPQSDGLVERFNRTIKAMLTAFVEDSEKDWDQLLPYVCHAYRATSQESTGLSPNLMMFGREIRTPLEVVYGAPEPPRTTSHVYAEVLIERMTEAHMFAREHLGRAAERQKSYYDRNAKGWELAVGDKVWQHDPVGNKAVPRKFRRHWTGPWTVVKKRSHILYDIVDGQGRSRTVHIDKLKKLISQEESEGEDDDVARSDNAADGPEFDAVEDDEEEGAPSENDVPAVVTRTGRKIRAPYWLAEYRH